jgi:uncharacterized membrane protein YfcA
MALAAAAALVGAAVQSATGFGFALILSPALLTALDPYEAVTALLALGLAPTNPEFSRHLGGRWGGSAEPR